MWRSVRWFAIHAAANAAISVCTWAAVLAMLADPLHANNAEHWPAPPLSAGFIAPNSHWPAVLVLAILFAPSSAG